MLPFPNTAKALEAYDKQSAEFNRLFDQKNISNVDVNREFAKLDEAAKAVGHAYGLDTAHINAMDTCEQCVRPGEWLREKVKRWKESLHKNKTKV